MIPAAAASAANDLGSISFDTAYPGEITTAKTACIYTIELTEPGRLSIIISVPEKSGAAQANVKWFDANDGMRIKLDVINKSGPVFDEFMDLETGTYFIEISQSSNYTGTYILKAQFTAAKNNEAEPNDTFKTAQLLDFGQSVRGFISYQDNVDIYKYVLTQPMKSVINITMPGDTGVSQAGVRWFDESGIYIKSNVRNKSEAVSDEVIELEAGIYFIEISQRQNYTGTYILKAQFTPTVLNVHSPWAKPELEKAYELALVPEILEGKDLTKPITRAEFAAIAIKAYENLSGTKAVPAEKNPFTDTNDAEVLKAFGAGITTGISENKFDPDAPLSREQAAAMLTRAYKKIVFEGWTAAANEDYKLDYASPSPFSDDDKISNWAKESVYFMAANGIIRGIGGNIFAPRANASREQAIIIAVRMIEKMTSQAR